MTTLNELVGSRWDGKAELWEDPLGNVAQHSDCTIAIADGVLEYSWSYQGKRHQGSLTWGASGSEFSDSWHQQKPVACETVPNSWGLLNVFYRYMEEWGWRINVCHRTPTGELVLQMTNIAPWGEEGRAVRMVCSRSEG